MRESVGAVSGLGTSWMECGVRVPCSAVRCGGMGRVWWHGAGRGGCQAGWASQTLSTVSASLEQSMKRDMKIMLAS